MVKIVIASGKGGVGKSMLASTLSFFLRQEKKVVAIDADVDAPNLHLWLGGVKKWDKEKKVSVTEKPVIDLAKCTGCGQCEAICAFQAIKLKKGKPVLNSFFCEGCGACEAVCPQKAIKLKKVWSAKIRVKKNLGGIPLVGALLLPGETGSGKIVDRVKSKASAFEGELEIIDAPAGTGCPVIAAFNGTNYGALVTEPTPAGLADLKRVLKVVKFFKIPYGVIVNKWDLNPKKAKEIEKWAGDFYLGKISYDQKIFKTIAALKPVYQTDLLAKKEIKIIYSRLAKKIKKL